MCLNINMHFGHVFDSISQIGKFRFRVCGTAEGTSPYYAIWIMLKNINMRISTFRFEVLLT